MLSRRSSKVSIKARKSKSTSSLKPQRGDEQYAGFKDEHTAHDNAVKAAGVAFDRSKEHDHRTRTQPGLNSSTINTNKSGLARQKSIRFAGPAAVPERGRSITRRCAPSYNTSMQRSDESFQSNIYPDEPETIGATRLGMTSLDDEHVLEYNIASQPSSYRKLKKAKSMFAPGKAASTIHPVKDSKAGRHFRRQYARSSESCQEPNGTPDQRLKKSYSFLRGVAENLSTVPQHDPQRDEAIRIARDEYLRQIEQQRLKDQPSFFNPHQQRNSRRTFRRSLRSSSSNPYGSAIASPATPIEPIKPSGVGDKARNFSAIVKNRVKKVFSRSRTKKQDIPAQQLDATRPHFGNTLSEDEEADRSYLAVPSPDAELLRRVNSRESFRSRSPGMLGESSSARSIRSAASLDDLHYDRSRVTSWTDSTAANTIYIPANAGCKRLSVIKEDGGPHQPSSSSTVVHNDMETGYNAFRLPYKKSVGVPPEPQRVFSALQREIGKKNSIPMPDNIELASDSYLRPSADDGTQQLQHDFPLYRGSHVDYSEVAKELTPQKVAQMNASIVSNRPLYESGSGFFPVYKQIEQTRTISPYRKALRSSTDDSINAVDSLRSKSIHPSDGSYDQHVRPGARSESIYSRTSGGHTPYASRSTPSLVRNETNNEPGTAVIISSGPPKLSRDVNPFRQARDISDKSTKSSREWKTKLASEMSYFDDLSGDEDNIYNALPVTKRGHKREGAQINGASELRVLSSGHRTQPDASGLSRRDVSSATSVMRKRISQPFADRSPLQDITPPASANANRQNENTPPPKKGSMRESSGRLGQKASQSSLAPRKENFQSYNSFAKRGSPERAERIRRLQSKSSPYLHSESDSLPDIGVRVGYKTDEKGVHSLTGLVTPGHGVTNIVSTPATHASKEMLVESFLKNRRKDMRITEENSSDAAFL